MSDLTPSQTVGPFFHRALPFERGGELVAPDDPRAIVIEGRLLDGAGDAVPDGLIETWQADANGYYRHPDDPQSERADSTFDGFGRVATDDAGRFVLTTIKPGAREAKSAPHLMVGVLARGLLTRLVTRMYFDDEAANESDAILALVPSERRDTLIAHRTGEDRRYRFDIVLQGPQETVFFDV